MTERRELCRILYPTLLRKSAEIGIQGILNYCKDTWWIQLIWTIVSMFLGALIGEFVGNIL